MDEQIREVSQYLDEELPGFLDACPVVRSMTWLDWAEVAQQVNKVIQERARTVLKRESWRSEETNVIL